MNTEVVVSYRQNGGDELRAAGQAESEKKKEGEMGKVRR